MISHAEARTVAGRLADLVAGLGRDDDPDLADAGVGHRLDAGRATAITLNKLVLPEPDGPITAVKEARLGGERNAFQQCVIAFDGQADVTHLEATGRIGWFDATDEIAVLEHEVDVADRDDVVRFPVPRCRRGGR